MSLKTLIDRLEPWCSGWNRSTGKKNLLHVIQVALDKLYTLDDTDRFVFRSTDNKGFPPYLITAAGTYRYNVEAANLSCGPIVKSIGGTNYTFVARLVKRVFIDANTSVADYFSFMGSSVPYIDENYGNNSERINIREIKVASEPGYGDAGQAPTVTFPFDPGTYTNKFFVEFNYGPPKLLSEAFKLPVPDDFIDDIETFCIGYCQGKESGRLMNDNLQYFENVVCPKFVEMMNKGATISSNETQLPGIYR